MENAAQISTKINTEIFEKNLHKRFVEYGKNAREWTRKCVLLLPEIAKYRIWEKRGFPNIYEYALKIAGMSRSAVDDALWIGKKIEDKPELKAVAEEKGIGAIKPVANLATTETASFWAEKIREMSRNTLRVYASEFKRAHMQAENSGDFWAGPKNYYENQNLFPDIKTETIQMEINPKTADELKKLKGAGNWDELMQKFIELYKEKLEAEKPQPVEDAKRYVPAALERYALAKTNGTCAFPGCTQPYEILHHTERFALTHEHNPDSLAPLCKAHEQLAHLGLIENEEAPPGEWRLRKQPDKTDQKYKIDCMVAQHRNLHRALCKSMFRSENCKFPAKTLKADEAVSGEDTARKTEKFAAEICNLQQEGTFAEGSIC